MKKKGRDNLMAMSINIALLIITKLIHGIPWWSFVLPVLIAGVLITLAGKDIASFSIGFLSGFIVWAGAMIYFNIAFKGELLTRIGHGTDILIPLLSGIVGGLLTGLAFYTGKCIVVDRITGLNL